MGLSLFLVALSINRFRVMGARSPTPLLHGIPICSAPTSQSVLQAKEQAPGPLNYAGGVHLCQECLTRGAGWTHV